jgi:hypothetical protein
MAVAEGVDAVDAGTVGDGVVVGTDGGAVDALDAGGGAAHAPRTTTSEAAQTALMRGRTTFSLSAGSRICVISASKRKAYAAPSS